MPRPRGPDGADLVILNTCHIREKAAEKVFSELGTIRRLKAARERRGGRMVIAVAGCVAQAEGEEILRARAVRRSGFGPQAYHRLPEMLARGRARRRQAQVLDTSFPAEPKFDLLPRAGGRAGRHRLSDRAGRLRQVLHLLRRPLHARRRIFAPGRCRDRRGAAARRAAARARSRCSGRTSTPITGPLPGMAASGGSAS